MTEATESAPRSLRLLVPVTENAGLESAVFSHFCQAPFFAVLDIDTNGVVKGGIIPSPRANDEQAGVLPNFVRRIGANIILAKKMGEKTQSSMSQGNITCLLADGDTLGSAAEAWANGDTVERVPLDAEGEHACVWPEDADMTPRGGCGGGGCGGGGCGGGGHGEDKAEGGCCGGGGHGEDKGEGGCCGGGGHGEDKAEGGCCGGGGCGGGGDDSDEEAEGHAHGGGGCCGGGGHGH